MYGKLSNFGKGADVEIFTEELSEINGKTGYCAYMLSLFKIHLETAMTLKANDDEVRESKTRE